jgi:hypothetical protein
MRASRDDDNRLSGTVRCARAQEALSFSGPLELMRVFEELVPVDPVPGAAEPAGRDGPGCIETGLAARTQYPIVRRSQFKCCRYC